MKISIFNQITKFLWHNRNWYASHYSDNSDEKPYYFSHYDYGNLDIQLASELSHKDVASIQSIWHRLIGVYQNREKSAGKYKTIEEFRKDLKEMIFIDQPTKKTKSKNTSEHIYVITGFDVNYPLSITVNIAFKTPEEAYTYCVDNSNEDHKYTVQKVFIGKIHSPKKLPKPIHIAP